jgi:hypothetical protein
MNAKFIMQILIKDPSHPTKTKSWKTVHPTGGEAYQYNTYDEAWKMLNICYPDVMTIEKRVIQATKYE